MPRPTKLRMVQGPPRTGFYKPQGVPLAALEEAVLPVEGLEAMRLVDGQGLDQQDAADLMGVSRPTLSRVLARARQTVANALAGGLALRIEGGDYQVRPSGGRGQGRGPGHGRGQGGRSPGGRGQGGRGQGGRRRR